MDFLISVRNESNSKMLKPKYIFKSGKPVNLRTICTIKCQNLSGLYTYNPVINTTFLCVLYFANAAVLRDCVALQKISFICLFSLGFFTVRKYANGFYSADKIDMRKGAFS